MMTLANSSNTLIHILFDLTDLYAYIVIEWSDVV